MVGYGMMSLPGFMYLFTSYSAVNYPHIRIDWMMMST